MNGKLQKKSRKNKIVMLCRHQNCQPEKILDTVIVGQGLGRVGGGDCYIYVPSEKNNRIKIKKKSK